MADKEDLRVQKTKKALSEAFIALLSEKTFEEITINELCDTAGVRRATFYKHYADKFSFLTAYTRALRDRFDDKIWKLGDPAPNKDYYVAYGKRIITFISENMTATSAISAGISLRVLLASRPAMNHIFCDKRYFSSIADKIPDE